MSYADPSYSKDNVNNYYLLTILGNVLGEASSTGDNLVAFSDDSVDNQGSYAVFVYKDYVNILFTKEKRGRSLLIHGIKNLSMLMTPIPRNIAQRMAIQSSCLLMPTVPIWCD